MDCQIKPIRPKLFSWPLTSSPQTLEPMLLSWLEMCSHLVRQILFSMAVPYPTTRLMLFSNEATPLMLLSYAEMGGNRVTPAWCRGPRPPLACTGHLCLERGVPAHVPKCTPLGLRGHRSRRRHPKQETTEKITVAPSPALHDCSTPSRSGRSSRRSR